MEYYEYDEEDYNDEDLSDEYDGSEDDDYHYHNHMYDDLYDDVGDDYDYDAWDAGYKVEAHEMFLFEYHPELLDDEKPDLFNVLELAEMTSKLVDAVWLRIGRVSSEDLQLFR